MMSDVPAALTTTPPWIIAIGASGSGGISDIQELLEDLPAGLRAVVLVVLHRSWEHPSYLRDVLGWRSHHRILVASDGERFEPGTVYIGEPSEHLRLAENSFGELLHDPEREHRARTIDLLFQSVAKHGKGRVIGIILSGALDDGGRGLCSIHKAGGLTMVLTPKSGAGGDMPKNAIEVAGPVELIGTPAEIARSVMAAIPA